MYIIMYMYTKTIKSFPWIHEYVKTNDCLPNKLENPGINGAQVWVSIVNKEIT